MKFSCPHCKICRIDNHLSPSLIHQLCVLREADVIANAYSNFTILCVKDGNLGRASSDIFTLIESNTTWNINIEQVKLSMLGHNLSIFIETETGIVNLIFSLNFLWETSTNNVFIERLR
jgi:hypothetical protein